MKEDLKEDYGSLMDELLEDLKNPEFVEALRRSKTWTCEKRLNKYLEE